MAVNDPIVSLFCCRFNTIHNGDLIYRTWSQLSEWSLQRIEHWLTNWVLQNGLTRAVIVEYGLENALDFPIFFWRELGAKVYPVKGIGLIYVLPEGYKARLSEALKTLPDGYAVLSYGKRSVRLNSLYTHVDLPPGTVGTVKAKVYFDFNGTYEFYVSPNVLSLTVDGKEYKPNYEERELMRDRMWGALTAKLKLNSGWHTIEVKVRRGFLAVYWKGPYSCAPQPVFGTRLGPAS